MKTRFVYTGIRVKDMTESVEFYTNLLGMKLLRRHKIDKTKGEIAVLTSENQDFYLELNWYEKDSMLDRYTTGLQKAPFKPLISHYPVCSSFIFDAITSDGSSIEASSSSALLTSLSLVLFSRRSAASLIHSFSFLTFLTKPVLTR